LNNALNENPNCASWALRCTLANLQVWGTLGERREVGEPGPEVQAADHDIEQFLRKDTTTEGEYINSTRVSMQWLVERGRSLSPEMLMTYHRRLARRRAGHARKEFRRRLSALQIALTQPAACSITSDSASGSSRGGTADRQASENAERLLRTVLHHLNSVESFVSSLSRFFKNVDEAAPYGRQHGHGVEAQQGCPSGGVTGTPKPRASNAMEEAAVPLSDSSDEKFVEGLKESGAVLQPKIDHATTGYIMHVDCGHNGLLDEVELRQLSLHLRAAGFGRTANDGLG